MNFTYKTATGNISIDVDEEWVLIRIKTPKGEKEKLIRLESIQTIGETQL